MSVLAVLRSWFSTYSYLKLMEMVPVAAFSPAIDFRLRVCCWVALAPRLAE